MLGAQIGAKTFGPEYTAQLSRTNKWEIVPATDTGDERPTPEANARVLYRPCAKQGAPSEKK